MAATIGWLGVPGAAQAGETYEALLGRWINPSNGLTVAIDGSNGSYVGQVIQGGSAECHPRPGERIWGRINGSPPTLSGNNLWFFVEPNCRRIGYGSATFELSDGPDPSLRVCTDPPPGYDGPTQCATWQREELDSDEDGLPDNWELSGINTDHDPQVEVRLHRMGADPMHKDLFVELDYMRGFRIGDRNLKRIVNAFEVAPLSNPDGSHGVTLHIDNGPDSVMNPLTGEHWGHLSEQDTVPYTHWFPYTPEGLMSTADAHLSQARRAAFRWGVAVDGVEGHRTVGDSYAMADRSGGTLMVFGFGNWPTPGHPAPGLSESGVFMHELGHLLGLLHGGLDDYLKKPNQLSVMNYALTERGMRKPGGDVIFDYSRFDSSQVGDLNEAFLSETDGASAVPNAAVFKSRRKCPHSTRYRYRVLRFNQPVDWDCDGQIEPGTVRADVTGDGEKHLLRSYDEWSAVRLRADHIGSVAQNFKSTRRIVREPPRR